MAIKSEQTDMAEKSGFVQTIVRDYLVALPAEAMVELECEGHILCGKAEAMRSLVYWTYLDDCFVAKDGVRDGTHCIMIDWVECED